MADFLDQGRGNASALFFWALPIHSIFMHRKNRFTDFACIDWSGAATERPNGIALAKVDDKAAPQLIKPKHRWSRQDVLDWILECATSQQNILIGLDLSFGFPFHDAGVFFPEWNKSPDTAPQLWELIDTICADDPYFLATSFLAHDQAKRHFRHSKEHVGDLFSPGIGRLRVVEHHQRATKQGNSWSCFNLVGAGQVGKSSLTGMRMLHHLRGKIPIWPFDPLPDTGPVIVEIYTSMAARAAGMPANTSKIRDAATLEHALQSFNAPMPIALDRIDDHATDALLTACWLRNIVHDPAYWAPKSLNLQIAQTEGWTFGVI
jgi:hypothetical protein